MNRPLLAALLLTATAAHADPKADPKADVLVAVDAALTAVSTNDAALFEKIMLPNAVIVAQNYKAADGSLTTRSFTVPEMAERLRTPGRKVDERRTATTVLVERDLAHVWADYTLDLDGKRLHCGVDSFGLVKQDGAWRISSLTWTAEPDGCPRVVNK
jgi:hypothetical protein